MQLQTIKIHDIKPSKTNPKGRTDGEDFEELMASIKEKGVLMPILVRPGKDGSYEVVAGHRRLQAAATVGLTEIPAQVADMDDQEAREAQLIENIQRKDVHPLEEAEAYKYLSEKSKCNVAETAKRVGKSERYVRDRLGLTNLSKKAAEAFRADEMTVTHAILISKVEDDKVQDELTEEATEYGMDTEQLKRRIKDHTFAALGNKPWAADEELAQVLGDETRVTLFDKDDDEIEDPVEHARKMAAFIEHTIRKETDKGKEIVKVSTSYGGTELKGVLNRDEYVILENAKERKAAGEDVLGIVVEGWGDIGRVVHISRKPEDIKGSTNTAHKLTPEERAERKKEREEEEKKKDKQAAAVGKKLAKLKAPLSAKHLDVLFEMIMDEARGQKMQDLVKLLRLEPVVNEVEATEYRKAHKERDYSQTIRNWAEGMGASGKLQAVFALNMNLWSEYSREEFLKKL